MMTISPTLQNELLLNIRNLEREQAMPYMNSFERYGREEGAREATRKILRILLERRFGALAPPTVTLLEQAKSDELLNWAAAAIDASSIEQVFTPR